VLLTSVGEEDISPDMPGPRTCSARLHVFVQVVSVSLAEIGRVFGAVTLIAMCGNMRNMPWAVIPTGEAASHMPSPVASNWGFG